MPNTSRITTRHNETNVKKRNAQDPFWHHLMQHWASKTIGQRAPLSGTAETLHTRGQGKHESAIHATGADIGIRAAHSVSYKQVQGFVNDPHPTPGPPA